MRKLLAAAAVPSVLTLLHGNVFAYDIPNHYDMSKQALSLSLLGKEVSALQNLGLFNLEQKFVVTPGDNTSDFTDGCVHSVKFSILNLVGCGAQFEDVPGTRSFNHFYDPVNNSPLTVKGVKPGSVLFRPNLTSPDWALKDNNDEAAQTFSYKDARKYFYDALTTGSVQAARDELWGKLFQSIGQVIHHIQDMAQPQHVRNDQHVDKPIPFLMNPSAYEKYTSDDKNRPAVQSLMSLVSADAVYAPATPAGFKLPRDFWRNITGTGLAEFTNANFVSAGTNFEVFAGQQVRGTKYASPNPGAAEPVLAKDLSPPLPSQVLAECAQQDCSMTFYGTSAGRPRAAALSIFDQYVQLRPVTYSDPMSLSTTGTAVTYQVDRLFTLNQYTFKAAHEVLIPRAVSYSAGLINYFFRGKMEISLPDEGIYGVADHALEFFKDTSGFRKIKLKLKNVTPHGTGIEPMATTGTLRAVVKFHRNTCYQPDRSGEYGAPGQSWTTCRAKDEEIVVSDVMAAPAGIDSAPQALTFNFQPAIPINATDLFLQVVYRGPLGDETDAVAVATVDIAEPHFLSFYDTTEQHMYGLFDALQTFKALYCDPYPAVSYEDCKASQKTSSYLRFAAPTGYDPAYPSVAAFNPTVTFEGITVSRFTRIAVLGNKAPLQVYGLKKTQVGSNAPVLDPQVYTGPVNPVTNQMDAATNTLTPQQVMPARGIYVYPDGYNTLTSGDVPVGSVPPMTPLTPMAASINF